MTVFKNSIIYLHAKKINRNIASHILQNLNMENEETLTLDLGCGPGTWIMVTKGRFLFCYRKINAMFIRM